MNPRGIVYLNTSWNAKRRHPGSFLTAAVFVAVLLLVSLFPAMAVSPLPPSEESLLTNKPKIQVTYQQCEYVPAESLVILRGDVNVIYSEVSISADEIVLDLVKKQAEAKGNVALWRAGEQLFCNYLVYDYENDRLAFSDTEYDGEFVFLKAPEIEAVEGGKEITATDAQVTTCDLPVPHYHFQAGKVRVEPGERFSIYNSWLKIGKTPVMYLPYFTRALEPEDPTHILSGGYSSKKGAYILNKFAWTFNDYLHLRLYADYYTELGPGFGLKNRYNDPEREDLEGFIYAYYLSGDSDNEYIQGPPETYREVDDDRWKIAGEHMQTIGEEDRLTIISRYQALSDEEYNEDFDDQETERGFTDEQLNYERNSFVNIAYRADKYNYRLTTKGRLDDVFQNEYPEEERLPQLRIDGLRRRLFDTPVFFKTGVEVAHFNLEQRLLREPNAMEFSQEADRADFDLEFTLPLSLPGGFQLIPSAGYQATYYANAEREYHYFDEDGVAPNRTGSLREEFDDIFRNTGEAGVELVNRLEARWETPGSQLWKRMRVITEPRIGFFYREPDVDLQDEMPEEVAGTAGLPLLGRFPRDGYAGLLFDERDTPVRTEEVLRFNLESKFEAQRKGGGTRRFAKHSFEVAYDFEPDEDPWAGLASELWVYPFEWMALHNYLLYDLNEEEVRQSNSSFSMRPWDRFALDVGLSTYDRFGTDGDQQDVYVNLFYQLSEKYFFRYEHRYDWDDSEVRENEFEIVRDLHDLMVRFVIDEENYEDEEYDLEFKVVFQFKLPGTGREMLLEDLPRVLR